MAAPGGSDFSHATITLSEHAQAAYNDLVAILSENVSCPVVSIGGDDASSRPVCHIFPKQTQDVVAALGQLEEFSVPFYLTFGDHKANFIPPNGHGRVCIDLSGLNEISLDSSLESVSLGIGAKWGDVYANLERHNLTVAGSMSAKSTVGEHILAGGYSWFSNEIGWSCDQLIEAEVLTPQRRIIRVSETVRPELFRAIKGSYGAFGIVRKVRMRVRRGARLHINSITFDGLDQAHGVFEAFRSLGQSSVANATAQAYLVVSWSGSSKKWNLTAHLSDTQGGEESPAMETFRRIPYASEKRRDMRLSRAARTNDRAIPDGLRHGCCTWTCELSVQTLDLLLDATRSFAAETEWQNTSVLRVIFQPLAPAHTSRSSQHCLLGPSTGAREPLMMVLMDMWWRSPGHDESFEERISELWEIWSLQLGSVAARRDFVYPAAAAKFQNPFVPLSAQDLDRLRVVRQRYDPDRIWQRLVLNQHHLP